MNLNGAVLCRFTSLDCPLDVLQLSKQFDQEPIFFYHKLCILLDITPSTTHFQCTSKKMKQQWKHSVLTPLINPNNQIHRICWLKCKLRTNNGWNCGCIAFKCYQCFLWSKIFKMFLKTDYIVQCSNLTKNYYFEFNANLFKLENVLIEVVL